MKIHKRPKANLNHEIKKKIIRLHEQGCSLSQIAEMLGLKMIHVMDVLNEKSLEINLSKPEDE